MTFLLEEEANTSEEQDQTSFEEIQEAVEKELKNEPSTSNSEKKHYIPGFEPEEDEKHQIPADSPILAESYRDAMKRSNNSSGVAKMLSEPVENNGDETVNGLLNEAI